MIEERPRMELYIQVCEHEKPGVKSCGPDLPGFRDELKKRVAQAGLAGRIRVMRSGCLGVCEEGPNVFLMPHHIWFRNVTTADLDPILDRARSLLSPRP